MRSWVRTPAPPAEVRPQFDKIDKQLFELSSQVQKSTVGPAGPAGPTGPTGPAGPGATPHALLDGNYNNDTTASAVARGSIVFGNTTPLWAPLAVGTNGQVLHSNGTDPSWQALVITDLPANVAILTGTNQTWTAENTLASAQIETGLGLDWHTPIPAVPAAGYGKLFADGGLGGAALSWLPASGIAKRVQSAVGWANSGWWGVGSGTSASSVINAFNCTVSGTASAFATSAPGTSGGAGGYKFARANGSASANAVAEFFQNSTFLWRGNAAGRGGFYVCIRSAQVNSSNVNGFSFLGLASAAVSLSTNQASALTQCLGIGRVAGASNWAFYSASSSNTSATLGVNYDDTPIQFEIYCPPNGSTVSYRVMALDGSSAPVTGSTSSTLPTNTTMLGIHAHTVSDGTAGAQTYIYRAYFESDN